MSGSTMFPLFVLNVPCIRTAKKLQPYTDEWSLIYLTLCQLCDFCWRMLPLNKKFVRKIPVKLVIVLCFARVGFACMFPMLSLPKAKVTDGELSSMPVIQSDVFAIINLVFFALLGSFTATIGYVKYQDVLDNEAEKARGSFILGAYLQTGLFLGSISSVCLIPLFK
ncbi:Nucleoside_transporter [Hexamita inflata]|uniref:Nucleoside_transporter n=1 Tax=Hexamita inflata TaxID=28002 RepID=A0ABP1HLW3_9EUKA